MKKFLAFAMIALAASFQLTSCSSDDDNTPSVDDSPVAFGITLSMPLNASDATLSDGTATLTNVQTNQTYTTSNFKLQNNQYTDTIQVPAGIYNVVVTGNARYTLNGKQVSSPLRATQNNVTINRATTTSTAQTAGVSLAASLYNASEGLVISELFYTNFLTPEGKSDMNNNAQYIRIANNSDSTMYLDGLLIVESAFQTDDKQDYTPNLMDSAITVDAVYAFPGSGHDYAIAPGQQITVAIDATNHQESNANSIDLSKADFEFYDVVEDNPDADTDNPNVPNLTAWYNASEGAFVLHSRGVKAYALVRPEVTMAEFNTNFTYQYTYKFVFGEYSFDMDGDGAFIPNSWVVDCVDLSVVDGWQWNVVSPTLDAGWTHCGTTDYDENRFGKAVVRKTQNGKWVDTNNSTNDFEANATPSLKQ